MISPSPKRSAVGWKTVQPVTFTLVERKNRIDSKEGFKVVINLVQSYELLNRIRKLRNVGTFNTSA